MYDVIYFDRDGRPTPVASGVERGDACAIAKQTAAARGAGRMVADASTRQDVRPCPNTVLVVGRIAQAA